MTVPKETINIHFISQSKRIIFIFRFSDRNIKNRHKSTQQHDEQLEIGLVSIACSCLFHEIWPVESLPDVMPRSAKVKSVATLETVREIGVYIQRFHNLDLFKQGWYRIKITVRWEDSENMSFGIPASVVQYEAPDMDPSSIYGVWRIDDTDNSFSTQSFRIKYARQDVHLYMMIVFNLSCSEFVGNEYGTNWLGLEYQIEDLATTAVILKFELRYAPATEVGADMQASPDDSPAAIHEFRIPPKALIGLHSYCPVHFDALHAVLVDVSIHVTLLKAASYSSALELPSNSANSEVIINKSSVSKKNIDKSCNTLNQGFGGVTSLDMKNVLLVKALLTSRDILLEELQKTSKAINESLDISEFVSIMSNTKLLNFVLRANQFAINVEVVGQGKPQNGLKAGNEALDFLDVEKLHSLSQNELLDCFHSLGDQLDNKTKILGFLCDSWAKDRKAEWSIWMLYSKVEMPHHYINSKSEESSHRGVHRRVSSLWKLPDDPLQTATTRAELHRRSIEQMRINNRSVQDMQIFGDLLHTPIVIVEHVMNVPRHCPSANSLLKHIGSIDSDGLPIGLSSDTIGKKFAPQSNARVLKIVVFGHHLDLRLVRNQWLLIDPKVDFLMSEANEDKTFGDFREMGHRLAKEVIAFLKSKMDKASRYGSLGDIRLSFVGHSIGNLIIRTAIADSIMEPFLCHLYTYVSDGYVPYHSARIESCQAASRDTSKKGKLFLEMLNACLDQIRANSMQRGVFMRCDVNFDASTQGKNLDSIIGRAAHIEFLDSDIFASSKAFRHNLSPFRDQECSDFCDRMFKEKVNT
ncbi:Protein FAM135A [Glycine max]|nr:Protein FAM135A [Glycine max]